MNKITLEDFKIRYKNIRRDNSKVKKCSISKCDNPRDSTPLLGEDTCCAYHRLLFDYWFMETLNDTLTTYYLDNQRARRSAFTRFRNRIGIQKCDEIVLHMAQDAINWKC